MPTHPASTPSDPGVLEMFGVFCNKLNSASFPMGLAQVWKLSLEPQGRTVASPFEKVTTSGFWGIVQLAGQLCSPHEARSTVNSCRWREPPRIGRANSSELGKRTHQEMIKGKRAKQNTNRTKQKLPPRESAWPPTGELILHV